MSEYEHHISLQIAFLFPISRKCYRVSFRILFSQDSHNNGCSMVGWLNTQHWTEKLGLGNVFSVFMRNIINLLWSLWILQMSVFQTLFLTLFIYCYLWGIPSSISLWILINVNHEILCEMWGYLKRIPLLCRMMPKC